MKNYSLKCDNLNINVNNYYEYLSPNYVFLDLNNHQTAKTVGDRVMKEESIVALNDYNVYAPISGSIKGYKKFKNYLDIDKNYLIIENNYKEQYSKRKSINKDYLHFDRIKVLEILQQYPNELLINVENFLGNHDHISKIMVKAFDDCLYNYNNLYYLQTDPIKLLDALDAFNQILKIDKSFYLVKSKDITAINNMVNYVGSYPGIELSFLPDIYPLSADSVLKKFIGTNVDDDTLIINIEELLCLYNLIYRNKCQTEKIVTITNLITKEVSFCFTKYNVLIGNLLKNIPENAVVYLNNPLNAHYIDVNNTILSNDVSAIIIDLKVNVEALDCYNCGKCLEVCPLQLKELTSSSSCIGCNLCSYMCPAHRNLLEGVNHD